MTRSFWLRHLGAPLLLMVATLAALHAMNVDFTLANLFYSATDGWLGRGAGEWWATRLIHTDGGLLVRALGACAVCGWLASFMSERMRPWRMTLGYIVIALALTNGLVGVLKAYTNVACPWDLAQYGGSRPYAGLFDPRPDGWARARCFPGAHSASGFALVCVYFALRDRYANIARWTLVGALCIGAIFSLGQQARGAHFLSHDLTSAAIAWITALVVYVRMGPLTSPAGSAASMPSSRATECAV